MSDLAAGPADPADLSDLSAPSTEATEADGPVLTRLSVLDRFLPAWIIAAMVLGIVPGRAVPSLADGLDTVTIGSVSLPIAVGLLLMMYPVLAKVRYRRLDRVIADCRLLVTSPGSSGRSSRSPYWSPSSTSPSHCAAGCTPSRTRRDRRTDRAVRRRP